MNKISAPSQVCILPNNNESENCKVYPRDKCQQADEICFRGATKSAAYLELCQQLIKIKCWKIKTFLAFKLSDIVFIMLVNASL